MECLDEKLETNISACFKATTANGSTTYTPKNSQGKLAKNIFDKNEQNFFLQLHSPLQSLDSLLVNDLDFGINIQFSDSTKYFITQTANAKPKFVIKGTTVET